MFSRKDRRPPGYYVVTEDWPSDIPSPNLTTEQLYAVLDRFDRVHGRAMSTQWQVDQANQEIEQHQVDVNPDNANGV